MAEEGQDAVIDVDELYTLPLHRFVSERNALARELRGDGRRDEAEEVAALRRPSGAARAVNRLAREHSSRLRELFKAGDALSKVHSRVLAGNADGRALAQAAERERAAVSSLVDTARELLAGEEQNPSAAVLDRVGETLHAAALDSEARERVAEGRLERELRHVGLGMAPGGDVDAAPRPRRAKTAPNQANADKRAQEAAARRRAELRRAAEVAQSDAQRRVERAGKALSTAERKRSRAAEALERAAEALREARNEAKAADTAHRRAQRELEALDDA